MSRFTVWIVQPLMATNPRCMVEVAAGVAYSLRMLGHEVAFDPGNGEFVRNPLPFADDNTYGRLIVFNGNQLPAVPLPPDAILFNAEQVQTQGDWGAAWQSSAYLGLLRRHLVWDYSRTNAANLASLGVERIVQCRVGFYPGLCDIPEAPAEDLDVLFVGSSNDRRVKLISEISRRGLLVRALNGAYGEVRNRWLARAKIVLNVHFYPQPIFEIFRVSHLLANRKCVVSEDNGLDPDLEAFAERATVRVPYERIADACVELVRDETRRREVAERGFEEFRKIDQIEEVRSALEASS